MDDLLLFLQPDLTRDELVWARKWAAGPLSCTVPSPGSNSASCLLQKGVGQADLNRLSDAEFGPQILHALYLLSSRCAPVVSMRPSHVVEKSRAILLPLREPKLVPLRNLSVFSFGPELSETQVLQDLVYVMQGIDGKFVRFVSNSVGVVNCQVSLHVIAAIRVVGEMGVLVRKLQSLFLGGPKNALLATFFEALKHELWEYQQIAALVDADLLNWTIVKLLAWIAVPVRKLRFLAAKANRVLAHPYMQLLSLDGSLFVSTFAPVKAQVESLYLRTIAAWVLEGRLPASAAWFFIEESVSEPEYPRILSSETQSTWKLWYTKYRLVPDRLPTLFAPFSSAIFQTGKSTILMNLNNTPKNSMFTNVDQLGADLQQIDYINQNVVGQFLKEFKFVSYHCKSLCNFLLLSEGVFASALIDHLTVELEKPAEYQNKFQLRHLIDLAFRESNFPICEEVCVNLSFATGPTSCGFEIFSLGYSVDPPLDVILTPDVVRQYSECFVQLFNLVRRETSLTRAWKELAHFGSPLVGKLQALRSDLWQFVHELRAVCCYDVVQVNWQKFEAHNADNLDALVARHKEYLDSIHSSLVLHAVSFNNCYQVVDRFVSVLPLILGGDRSANMESLIEDIHDSFLRELAVLGDELRDSNVEISQTILFKLAL